MATLEGKKTGGRKKGTPNKNTKALRDMILTTLTKAGGEEYLLEQSKKEPKAFLTLLGKVLPTQVTGDPENPIHITEVVRKIIKPK